MQVATSPQILPVLQCTNDVPAQQPHTWLFKRLNFTEDEPRLSSPVTFPPHAQSILYMHSHSRAPRFCRRGTKCRADQSRKPHRRAAATRHAAASGQQFVPLTARSSCRRSRSRRPPDCSRPGPEECTNAKSRQQRVTVRKHCRALWTSALIVRDAFGGHRKAMCVALGCCAQLTICAARVRRR